MKTFLVSLLLVVSFASTSLAQGLRVGVKLGGTLSYGVGKDVSESKLRTAYHGGAVFNIGLGILGDSVVSIQPEVLYSIKGDQATSYGPSILAQLTYVDVPLLLKVNAGGLYFEAGPQVSYLLSSTRNPTNATIDSISYRKSDLGVAIGFGYQDPKGMNVGWRYTRGFNNVLTTYDKSTVAAEATNPVLRNTTIQLYVGFLFNRLFGKK
jgi:hypothetical protein